jgi:hypothetical protein
VSVAGSRSLLGPKPFGDQRFRLQDDERSGFRDVERSSLRPFSHRSRSAACSADQAGRPGNARSNALATPLFADEAR